MKGLKEGLKGPLGGMGLSFSSSMFGLAGSLVLGFLDLKASQAQNRFYNDLEEWLSSMTRLGSTGGTSDARFIRSYCPVLEFGPTNATIHQTDERIAIDELRATQAVYSRIIADYFSAEL